MAPRDPALGPARDARRAGNGLHRGPWQPGPNETPDRAWGRRNPGGWPRCSGPQVVGAAPRPRRGAPAPPAVLGAAHLPAPPGLPQVPSRWRHATQRAWPQCPSVGRSAPQETPHLPRARNGRPADAPLVYGSCEGWGSVPNRRDTETGWAVEPRRRRQRPTGPWVWVLLCAVIVGGTLLALRLFAATTPPAPRAAAARPWPPAAYSPLEPPPRWPDPLPYPVVIAEAAAGRLVEVSPTGHVLWRYALPPLNGVRPQPNDAAFSPHGHALLLTAEHQDLVARLDFASRRLAWVFGVPGQAGAGRSHLHYPDDAAPLPNGAVAIADIRNCRELLLSGAGHLLATWGRPQSGYCHTNPAGGLFGYPNGSTPQADGRLLLTFASGDRVALLSRAGHVLWNVPTPDLYGGFASDAQLSPSGDVVVCGYARTGSVVAFNPRTGAEAWHYFVPSGPGALAYPTVALPLPGGDALIADSGHNRVVLLDPATGRLVWSYSTGLRDPQGLALDQYRNWLGFVPPRSGGAHSPRGSPRTNPQPGTPG